MTFQNFQWLINVQDKSIQFLWRPFDAIPFPEDTSPEISDVGIVSVQQFADFCWGEERTCQQAHLIFYRSQVVQRVVERGNDPIHQVPEFLDVARGSWFWGILHKQLPQVQHDA